MSKIRFGTTFINEDEPCLGLSELDLQSPGAKGFHRYQVVYVMRADKPAEYRKDMGPSKNFKHDQFRIPGGFYDSDVDRYYVEHTVGELRQIADDLRAHPYPKETLQHLEGPALIKKMIDQLERKQNLLKGRV
jgi:hypothetical protein